MKKVYTVGKITDNPKWTQQFSAARAKLKDKYIVLSPLDYPEGLTQKEYMMLSVQNVFIADLIITLDTWQDSPGAIAEVALAKSVKTEIATLDLVEKYLL